jgi:type III pantothenate kinase
MRILAVDAGNSRIKWGLHENGSWLVQGWVNTAQGRGLARAWNAVTRPDVVLATNVAGSGAARAIAAAASRFQRRVRFVTSQAAQCGVKSAYANPAQLGPDRWAALIAARHLHHGPCVVVNVGTTMTVDALASDGVFLGGLIVAGTGLMREALARGTARLKPRGGKFAFFPAQTADAIESGAINALAGAVERMLRFMGEAGQADPLTLVSGGAAELVAPQLNATVEVVDNLVLEGIVCIARDAPK